MISEILRKVIINNYCLFEGIPTYYCNEGFSLEAEISNLRKLIKDDKQALDSYQNATKDEKIEILWHYFYSSADQVLIEKQSTITEFKNFFKKIDTFSFLKNYVKNTIVFQDALKTYLIQEITYFETERNKDIKEEIIDKFKEKEQRFLHNRKEVLLENQKELDLAIENYSKLEKFVKLLDLTLGG